MTFTQAEPISLRKPTMGWRRRFDDPIPLPRGRKLVTLMDAGEYIEKLPEAEHEAAEWQDAVGALIMVAKIGGPGIMAQTHGAAGLPAQRGVCAIIPGGPTMLARIGVMRALNRQVVREFIRRARIPVGNGGSWRVIDEKGPPTVAASQDTSAELKFSYPASSSVRLWGLRGRRKNHQSRISRSQRSSLRRDQPLFHGPHRPWRRR